MRKFRSYEKEIFRELYRKRRVKIYTFFLMYKLSPGYIAKFIKKCELNNLAIYSDGFIQLTDNGVSFIEKNKTSIYLTPNRYWKDIPNIMLIKEYPSIQDILYLSNNDIKSFEQYKDKKGAG